ncbi:MAG: redox-regulated ATPase YchF [Candidatus Methylomirabilia bacterium]
MSLSCGLVGLPNAGKSTIFSALTGTDTLVASYPFSTLGPKKGVVPVPDPRLEALARLLHPGKVTPATLEVVDIAGLVEGASRGEGLGNQFLSHIRAVDTVLHVVRCFAAGQVPHLAGELAPGRDADIVNTEILLADLELVERRVDHLKKAKRLDPKASVTELALAERCHEALARGQAIRALGLDDDARRVLKGWGLLSAKALCYVANVDRGDPRRLELAQELAAASAGTPVVEVDGKLEGELALLPADEQQAFLEELGLGESALQRLVRVGYQLSGLITFYTVVGTELSAWSLPDGATALEAAGRIHTDLARGFVRAEVVRVEEFLATPSLTTLRERGTVRLEGREYRVSDGAILTIRFAP